MDLFERTSKLNEITPEFLQKTKIYDDDPHSTKIKKEYIIIKNDKNEDSKPAAESNLAVEKELSASTEANDNPKRKNDVSSIEIIKNNSKKIKLKSDKNNTSKICPFISKCIKCDFGDNCKYNHDLDEYVKNKPKDLAEKCYIFEKYGFCQFGLSCRFGSSHLRLLEDGTFENIKRDDSNHQINHLLNHDLKTKLWKRKYDFSKSDKIIKKVDNFVKGNNIAVLKYHNNSGRVEMKKPENHNSLETLGSNLNADGEIKKIGCLIDDDLIKLRSSERKQIDWKNKLYLAPLTTVGNLPYRRLCKEFGVDITCSEMAMSTNLLSGQVSEWALLKRHESEDLFGVQLAGSYPDTFCKATQLIQENINVDFIDINSGCPIDLLYDKGGGCALMTRLDHFQKIIRSMDTVSTTPITVKIRTGIKENVLIAHDIIPEMKTWGASMITLHGRTRQQRYSKLADWKYIDKCAQLSDPIPLFGCGDILSHHDYYDHMNNTHVSGQMIARGALYKPWIFTEIKEQRDWDISASERFDILKKYANYGLEHWGSDSQGVETTRRFMLEWMSFLYRYIPVGILERVPQCINQRPPSFFCRNDLETIMASPNCSDWIKMTEWFLGPVPDGFVFQPKHKANAY